MTGQPTEVVDLVAALRASVEAAKQRREQAAEKPRACTHEGCPCRLFEAYCWVRGDWQCGACMHPKGEHHQPQPQVQPLPEHLYPTTCDWGGCDEEAVAERLSGEAAGEEFDGFSAWLPVCAEHAKSVA